jgi:hypothetical protein
MSLRTLRWDHCPSHGHQLHNTQGCVSCAKAGKARVPSYVNAPIGAVFNNQSQAQYARALRRASRKGVQRARRGA